MPEQNTRGKTRTLVQEKTPEKQKVKQLESQRRDRKTFWETNQKIFEHQSKRTDCKVMCAGI